MEFEPGSWKDEKVDLTQSIPYEQISTRQPLLVLDEGLFYRLLEGPGKVEVKVAMLDQFFVPLVSFFADEDAPGVEYGAIVRNRTDILAAETMADLLAVLEAMTGRAANMKVVCSGLLARQIVAH